MPRKKYVTTDEFQEFKKQDQEFKTNDFAHLKDTVNFLKGQMWVIVGLVSATFVAILAVLLD